MTPNNLLTAASFVCFSLPIFVIVYYRLYRHFSIVALLLYCGLKLFQFSIEGAAALIEDSANDSEMFFNFLELPLLLSALLLFCTSGRQQEKMQGLVLLFVLYEIFVLLFVDYAPVVGQCIVMPGTLLVVLHSLFLFQQQMRFTLTHKKNGGRLLILGAIVFTGSFRLAGLFLGPINYAPPHSVYLLLPDISALVLSLGLYTGRHRIKGLQELKIARREMRILYEG